MFPTQNHIRRPNFSFLTLLTLHCDPWNTRWESRELDPLMNIKIADRQIVFLPWFVKVVLLQVVHFVELRRWSFRRQQHLTQMSSDHKIEIYKNVWKPEITCTQGRLDYNWFYSLKHLAHFWSKVLVDFLHSITQINELTGAIIARTHITNNIFKSYYNYTIFHKRSFFMSLKLAPLSPLLSVPELSCIR